MTRAGHWIAQVHATERELRLRMIGAGRRALRRLAPELPAIAEKTAAATLAWFIAAHVADHSEPFFAPIAAVIALNAPLGERGPNALRLLLGVFVGIFSGELAFVLVGGGYGTMALGCFVAMTIATVLGGARMVVGQSAASAILTIMAARIEVAANRLEDALIGGGVALVFSQFLFSPEPVQLLRRAESAALREMAIGLELTSQALVRDEPELVERALRRMREQQDRLAELARTRRTSMSTTRYSPIWRGRRSLLVGVRESSEHLDLLGGSCVMLTRVAMVTKKANRPLLAPCVKQLAETLRDLAADPGDRARRQRAADRAREIARAAFGKTPPEPALSAAKLAMRTVAADVMLFAGVPAGAQR